MILSKYFSTWTLQIFILWYLAYNLNIKIITDYLNPYYATILSCIGFTLLMIYYILIRKETIELTFLLALSLIHYGPLYVMYRSKRNNYPTENLLILFGLYLLFIAFINKDVFNIYLKEKHPLTWKELTTICRLKKKNYIPFCFIYNLINTCLA